MIPEFNTYRWLLLRKLLSSTGRILGGFTLVQRHLGQTELLLIAQPSCKYFPALGSMEDALAAILDKHVR